MLSRFFKQYGSLINDLKQNPKAVIKYNHILFDTKVAKLIERNNVNMGHLNSLEAISNFEKRDFEPLYKHDAYVYHIVQKIAQLTKNGIWIDIMHTKRYLPYVIDESLSYKVCKAYWNSCANAVCDKKAPMPQSAFYDEDSEPAMERYQSKCNQVKGKRYFVRRNFYKKHPLPDKATYDSLMESLHVHKKIDKYVKHLYSVKDAIDRHHSKMAQTKA